MKQRKPENIAPIKSTLAYDASFKASFLKPMYWGTWLMMVFLWFVMLLPVSVQDGVANKLGDLLRSSNKKRRRISRKNIELCFPDLPEAEKKN